MRLEILDGDRISRQVGAAVVRPDGIALTLEFGPADGPAITRLVLSKSEAKQLVAALRGVLAGRDEEIILVEE